MQFKTQVAHPWHGLGYGSKFPEMLTAYIEITPFDTVKYELDKDSGLLKVDRPQKFSNLCPALYGFVPQTYCGVEIGAFCSEKTGLKGIIGDGDPLDICVLSEKPINQGNIILQCRPIGGLRMIDAMEADDKIVAVLKDDLQFGDITDISQLNEAVVRRLKHYFLTYKLIPGEENKNRVQIPHVYDAAEAKQVLRIAAADYKTLTGEQPEQVI